MDALEQTEDFGALTTTRMDQGSVFPHGTTAKAIIAAAEPTCFHVHSDEFLFCESELEILVSSVGNRCGEFVQMKSSL